MLRKHATINGSHMFVCNRKVVSVEVRINVRQIQK
jgi:hypothetical protein